MRAAIYARYSTALQSASSIEDQIRLCQEHAKRHGWTVTRTFSDAALSGASILRPGLQNALLAAREGAIDVILAEALDRISRDQEDVAGIFKRLVFAGVKLVTLSEGEIGALHVGLKGTMNAIFLQDLAAKTRRGMRGKVEGGKAVAGLSYGYKVTGVGERAIDEAQAAIVRRIFTEYAHGSSPRAIAIALNAERVPGPRGHLWGPLTLVGQRSVSNGVLNNELYIGKMIWNRQRFIKDPDTRKRISRKNPRSEWITIDVPGLRILTDDLWAAAKARQKTVDGKPLVRRKRGVHLFSGLVKCGHCGGGMSIVCEDRIGCTNSRDRGTCKNRHTIKRSEVEQRVLKALQTGLMRQDLFKAFCESYTAEINRLRMDTRVKHRAMKAELEKATKELDVAIDAILQGAPVARFKERMEQLEARREALKAKVAAAAASDARPYLHPNMADVYRKRINELAAVLEGDAADVKARSAVRSMIERILVTPAEGRDQIELIGDLAGILYIASEGRFRAADTADRSATLVAGHHTQYSRALAPGPFAVAA